MHDDQILLPLLALNLARANGQYYAQWERHDQLSSHVVSPCPSAFD